MWSELKRVHAGRTLAACVLAISIGLPAAACINTFKSGVMEARGTDGDKDLNAIAAEAEARHRADPSLENTNDLAVAWILTHRKSEAIELLRDLEKRMPGNAIVAANLGTALELDGENEEALTWIRESVRRDPQEHQGSEWVHVRILEAKLALERDPHWLRKNSVVGWREGQRLPPDERSQPRKPRELVDAITYQLEERTQFVDSPDPIVADLYLTLGDLAHTFPATYPDTWERDEKIASHYRNALYYRTVHAARARERMDAADARVEAARPAQLAAEQQEQEARDRVELAQRNADQIRARQREEQLRRRWLGLGVFGGFVAVVAVIVMVVRRRRGTAPPDSPA